MDRFYLYFVLMKKGSVMKTIGKLQSAGLRAAVFCAAALAGCGGVSSGSAEPAVRHAPPAGSVLKVGTDPTFPPFEYYRLLNTTRSRPVPTPASTWISSKRSRRRRAMKKWNLSIRP